MHYLHLHTCSYMQFINKFSPLLPVLLCSHWLLHHISRTPISFRCTAKFFFCDWLPGNLRGPLYKALMTDWVSAATHNNTDDYRNTFDCACLVKFAYKTIKFNVHSTRLNYFFYCSSDKALQTSTITTGLYTFM